MREALAVALVHVGKAVDVAAQLLDTGRRAQPELHLLERLEVRPERVGVGAEPQGEVWLDAVADLALVDDLHVGTRPADDLVAERVEGAHLAPGVAGEVGEPVLHVGAGAPVVRECTHAGCAVAPLDHQVAEAGREHGGLARARGREDPRRSARVEHGGALVGCEAGDRRAAAWVGADVGAQRPRLDREAVHESLVFPDREARGARAAVAPRGCAVGEQHVGGAADRRADPARFRGRAPARCAVACVVVVGADEEVATLA